MMISWELGREKPVCEAFRRKSWNPSGRRIKRGLYQSQHGLLVNADINGAANILKKVATTLGFCLEGVGRGNLTMPLRVRFWTT